MTNTTNINETIEPYNAKELDHLLGLTLRAMADAEAFHKGIDYTETKAMRMAHDMICRPSIVLNYFSRTILDNMFEPHNVKVIELMREVTDKANGNLRTHYVRNAKEFMLGIGNN